MKSTSPWNSLIGYSLKWRCCSLVWPKSLWQNPELEFVNLKGAQESIPSLAGRYDNPFLTYRPAWLHRLAESIPWNRFLGSVNVYKIGLHFDHPSVIKCPIRLPPQNKGLSAMFVSADEVGGGMPRPGQISQSEAGWLQGSPEAGAVASLQVPRQVKGNSHEIFGQENCYSNLAAWPVVVTASICWRISSQKTHSNLENKRIHQLRFQSQRGQNLVSQSIEK
jgi:hypothetical protein